MARMNTKRTSKDARSPITSEATASGRTFEGAPGFAREAKSELFLAAVSSLNEDSFYESADARAERIAGLVREVAVADPMWTLALVRYLRSTVHLRSIPVIVAAHAAKARLDAEAAGTTRQIVDASIGRADELGEFLAYWKREVDPTGKTIPSAVKRGVSDAASRVLNERSVMKWKGKGAKGDFSFADVLNLVHASPKDDAQDALFAHIVGKETDLDRLPVMKANAEIRAMSEADLRELVVSEDGSERLQGAGITWEALSGMLPGGLGAEGWEAMVPNLGYQALLMNLRNISEAGVSEETIEKVSKRLSDPSEVARSKMMPIRFLSAYMNAPLAFHYPLEKALGHSLANIPDLPGRSLVLVDRSGSMGAHLSARSSMTRMDVAGVFGAALAVKNREGTDLVTFGTASDRVAVRRGESVLGLARRIRANDGGTYTAKAVRKHFKGHDRVIVLTDDQATYDALYGEDVYSTVPSTVPVFTVNLGGYRYGSAPAGSKNRHSFGGLTDRMFDLIPLLERGGSADWSFMGA